MRLENEAGAGDGTGGAAGGGSAAAAAGAAAAGTQAQAGGGAAAGTGDFKPEVATQFFTEHGVDAKTLEGLKPEELQARYTSAKAIADKAAERAKASAPKAPEKYTLQAPKDVQVDAELGGEFEAIARKHNLSNEAAQEFFNLGAKSAQKSTAAVKAAVEKVQAGWADAAAKDTEYGGEKFQENLQLVAKAREVIASPETRKFLDESKLGNHPELIRIFFRVGKLMKEDKLVNGQGSRDTSDIATRLYGKTSAGASA